MLEILIEDLFPWNMLESGHIYYTVARGCVGSGNHLLRMSFFDAVVHSAFTLVHLPYVTSCKYNTI